MPKPKPSTIPPNYYGTSGLEIRVCTRTYRIFYVPDTAEYLWNRTPTLERKAGLSRSAKIKERQERWVKAFREGDGRLPSTTTTSA